jgi:hypothetical protein
LRAGAEDLSRILPCFYRATESRNCLFGLTADTGQLRNENKVVTDNTE